MIVWTENTDCGNYDLINGSKDVDPVWIYLPASEAWIKVKVKLLSRVRLFVTPWTVARQAPLFMRFSRQEYWSGLPFPSPRYLPNTGIEPRSPALQADFTVWATREAWMWDYNKFDLLAQLDGKHSSIHGTYYKQDHSLTCAVWKKEESEMISWLDPRSWNNKMFADRGRPGGRVV